MLSLCEKIEKVDLISIKSIQPTEIENYSRFTRKVKLTLDDFIQRVEFVWMKRGI